MKKVLSILLAIALLFSMSAGLQLTAWAAIADISFEPAMPVVVYTGFNVGEETGTDLHGDEVTFTHYYIDEEDMTREGNTLTLTYDNGTQEAFVCQWTDRGDYEELAFVSENENELDREEFLVDDNQSADSYWEVGGSYEFFVEYKGHRAAVPVTVEENPIRDVSVTMDGPVQLIENHGGHWEHDGATDEDYYCYHPNYDYLKYQNARISVTYADERGTVDYHFIDEDWMPVDDEGNRLDEWYFSFEFVQHRNHFAPGAENESYLSYYWVGPSIDVEVREKNYVDEGELTEGETVRSLFIESEPHYYSFTPDESGCYVFTDGLIWQLFNSDQYTFDIRCGDEIPQSLDNNSSEELFYYLESGKTYTITVTPDKTYTSVEKLCVEQRMSVTDLQFIPTEELTVYEGGLGTDELLYQEGNQLLVTFSDGTQKCFTCNDNWSFVDEDGNWADDYAYSMGVEMDCYPHIEANTDSWKCGEEAYITVFFGNASCRADVTVIPSPISDMRFTPAEPLKLYAGTSHEEWMTDQNGEWNPYQRYDIEKWLLDEPGNTLILTDNNGVETVYTADDFYEEATDEGGRAFIAESGEKIFADDLQIIDSQNIDNPWEVGNTYSITLIYLGKRLEVPISVVPSPIRDFSVTVDKSITLFEMTNGDFQHDDDTDEDWFEYWMDIDYLSACNPVFTVTYDSGEVKEYRFRDHFWGPVDEDGNELDMQYLSLQADQWTKHFTLGDDNEAYVKYYDKTYRLPLTVIPKGTVDEGELTCDSVKRLFFAADETHRLTFTPEQDGIYVFEDSLADSAFYGGEYAFRLSLNGTELSPCSTDRLAYALEGGKTYMIEADKPYMDLRTEWLSVRKTVLVTAIDFQPTDDFWAYEGETSDGDILYIEGNKFILTFSDGTTETFVKDNDEHAFINNKKVSLDEYLRAKGVEQGYIDATPSSAPWAYTDHEYFTVSIGGCTVQVPVRIVASTVDSIEFIPQKPLTLLDSFVWWFEMDGRWMSEINDYIFHPGDILRAHYNDGRGTVDYRCINEYQFVNVNDENDIIAPYYYYDDTREYCAGDTVDIEVRYQTSSAFLTGTVIQNDVQAVTYMPAEPFTYEFENGGEWRSRNYWNDQTEREETEDFYYYPEKDLFAPGSVMTVTYSDKTVSYTSDGEHFIAQNGETLNNEYINVLWGRDQYQQPWKLGSDNTLYVHYQGIEGAVPVTIIEAQPFEMRAEVWKNGELLPEGTNLTLCPGESVFLSFFTDDRNMSHGIAPLVGFSDGYPEGTLTQAGFTTATGTAAQLGVSGVNPDWFGVLIQTDGVPENTTAPLNYYLYVLPENFSFDTFDFVNTPHAKDYSMSVTVAHSYEKIGSTPATCTTGGSTEYRCTKCGATYSEPTSPLGHDFSNNAEYCRRGCGTRNPNYQKPATDGSGQGGSSAPVVNPPAPVPAPLITAPAKPAWKKVKAGKKSAQLTWKPAAGAVTYEIQYGTNKKFKKAKTKKVSAAKLKLTLKKLKKGKKYYFRIRAVNSAGPSAWSKTKSAKVK